MKIASYENQSRIQAGLRNSLVLLSLVGLTACSAEVTAPPVNFPTPPAPQTASKAMAVEGTWASNCFGEQGLFHRQTMTFKDDSLSAKVDSYTNAACSGSPVNSATVDGTMIRFGSSVFVSGGHDVEITVRQPDGLVEKSKAVFLIEGGLLFTSDSEDAAGPWPNSVDRSRPYTYIGG